MEDGWTEVMWVDTQKMSESDEEAEALERTDFETMEAIRRRVAQIVKDPDTAERLKPYWGKHCKRVCFHDEYLPAFNRTNVHLVDTEGQGVDAITARGPVVNGVEYPLDLLIYASGFEVTTDLHQRLGFDPKGVGGIALSERWAQGAHTLHGVMASGFPNLLLISLVQGGFGTNFSHLLSEAATHVAHIVEACESQGIAAIEPETDAEEEWLSVLHAIGFGHARYFASCTPSFYNSEQQSIDTRAARNLTYSGACSTMSPISSVGVRMPDSRGSRPSQSSRSTSVNAYRRNQGERAVGWEQGSRPRLIAEHRGHRQVWYLHLDGDVFGVGGHRAVRWLVVQTHS